MIAIPMESTDYNIKDVLLTIVIVSLTLLFSFVSNSSSDQKANQNFSATSNEVENSKGINSIN